MIYLFVDCRRKKDSEILNILTGIVDAPKHATPRLLINYDLVGSFGARPQDFALLGDRVKNIDRLCEVLDWTDDLLEAQMENELKIK